MSLRLTTPFVAIHAVEFLEARRQRDGGGAFQRSVQIEIATAAGIPASLDGIVLTSDLQGQDTSGRLAGLLLARELATLAARGEIPGVRRLGVIVAGDLFGDPARRSGSGDVAPVWRALSGQAAWLVGVGGNHDHFGSDPDNFLVDRTIFNEVGIGHLLDGDVVERSGLRIGGVSGIAGRVDRYLRRSLDEQIAMIHAVANAQPDVLVLHEGPAGHAAELEGNAAIQHALQSHRVPLVVCGHRNWPVATTGLSERTMVMNTDNRALLLLSESWAAEYR